MEFVVVVFVLLLGVVVWWAVHERQERLIAKRGYSAYIEFSPRWKAKRQACYKRFGYRCAICNSPRNLEAHHRTYARLFNERPEDLTCLCKDCHRMAPRSKGLWKT